VHTTHTTPDFEGTTLSLGKPALNDITQGLATAPVLFAAHRYPNLLPIIQRKFEVPGDVDMAVKGIQAAGGMALTRKLAVAHGQLALDAIKPLVDSPARTALASMVSKILSRSR
jgi:geranylgeranyl pyrophosphate synthase